MSIMQKDNMNTHFSVDLAALMCHQINVNVSEESCLMIFVKYFCFVFVEWFQFNILPAH